MRTIPAYSMILMSIVIFLTEMRTAQAHPWFSESGRFMAFFADSGDQEVSIWELPAMREVRRVRVPAPDVAGDFHEINSVSISEKSGLIACGSEKSLTLWSLKTGELLWSDPIESKEQENSVRTSQVAFLENGERLASVSKMENEFRICIRNSRDGSNLKLFGRHVSPEAMELSKDGRRVFGFGSNDDSRKEDLNCWDTESGKLLGQFRFQGEGSRFKLISAGNEILAEVTDYMGRDRHPCDSQVILWDLSTYGELRRIRFRSGSNSKPAILEERDALLLTLGPDNSAGESQFDRYYRSREYSMKSGEPVSEHLIPWGLDWGIEGSRKDIVSIPGTAACCWCSSDDRTVLFIGKRQSPRSQGATLQIQTYKGRRDTSVLIAGTTQGIVTGSPESLQVYHPGQDRTQLKWENSQLNPTAIRKSPKSVQQIAATLLEPQTMSQRTGLDSSKPRLFLMTVGVSDYEREDLDGLNAARNALEINAVLGKNEAGQFSEVQIKNLTNKQVTMENLREALAWLKRSPTPKDSVVMYWGGHAFVAERGLYFAPHEADDLDLNQTCMNWSEISESLLQLKAAHAVVLLDCDCAGAFAKIRHSNQDTLVQNIEESDRLMILASCDDKTFTAASSNQDTGWFANALSEGLTGKADGNDDGIVNWMELVSFVKNETSTRSNGKNNPVDLKSANGSFAFKVKRTTSK